MKLFKFNYYIKLVLLGLFVTTSFTACQDDQTIPQEPVTQQEASRGTLSTSGTQFLIDHENCGGHTIERHIAKSDEFLYNRLATSSISAASTFFELNQAAQVIENAIHYNWDYVNDWINGNGGFRLVLEYTHTKDIGKVLRRDQYYPYNTRSFKVVLQRSDCLNYGYMILTAYPV